MEGDDDDSIRRLVSCSVIQVKRLGIAKAWWNKRRWSIVEDDKVESKDRKDKNRAKGERQEWIGRLGVKRSEPDA